MSRRVETLIWLGLFAPPIAWAATHVLGWALSEANCEPAGRRWGIAFDTWEGVMLVVAALLALAGTAASAMAYRQVKGVDKDADPPPGRVWILSLCGLVIGPLMFMSILLTHVATLTLSHCHQG